MRGAAAHPCRAAAQRSAARETGQRGAGVGELIVVNRVQLAAQQPVEQGAELAWCAWVLLENLGALREAPRGRCCNIESRPLLVGQSLLGAFKITLSPADEKQQPG